MPKRRMTFAYPSKKRARRANGRAPTRALGRLRFRRRRRQYIPRTITPDSKMCRLRYCFTAVMNPSSGATANLIVRANDLVDPSPGISGSHQPMGYDQIMDLYERFCVVGSKINVAFANTVPNSSDRKNGLSIVGIALRNNTDQESVQDTTGGQSNEGLLERNRTKWRYTGNQMNGAPLTQVTHKFGAKKFFHLKSINDNAGNNRQDGTLWGRENLIPGALAYYKIFCAPFIDTVDTSFNIRVTVDYTAVFQGRKLLAQS